MSQQFTEADYDIDISVVMGMLGIEPGHVAADSARLEFVSGKAVLRYEVIRAVPAKLLAIAMAQAAGLVSQPEHHEPERIEGQMPDALGLDDEPTYTPEALQIHDEHLRGGRALTQECPVCHKPAEEQP